MLFYQVQIMDMIRSDTFENEVIVGVPYNPWN